MQSILEINPLHSTYSTSHNEPFAGWYPYLEGYAIEFVNMIIQNYCPDSKNILDPFGGNGTTAFAAALSGRTGAICEVNPLMKYIYLCKKDVLSLSSCERKKLSEQLSEAFLRFKSQISNLKENDSIKRSFYECFAVNTFFEENIFSEVLKARQFSDELYDSDSEIVSRLFDISVVAVIILASLMKRAGDLRCKTPREIEKGGRDFLKLLEEKISQIAGDIANDSFQLDSQKLLFLTDNAKQIPSKKEIYDALITSPPYPNGTNYFRNTKIELWYLRFLNSSEDLGEFRRMAVTAGINDVTKGKHIESSVKSVVDVIGKIREVEYDKRISSLVSTYFSEMEGIFERIYPSMKAKSKVIIDIGDSNYAGIHVRVDEILIDVLRKVGFIPEENIKIRSRISKNGFPLSQSLLILSK